MSELHEMVRRELEYCRLAVEAGNEGALADALALCIEHDYHPPVWVLIAARERVVDSINHGATTGKGRHAQYKARWLAAMTDLVRAETVDECVENGIPKRDAFEAASILLERSIFHGGPDAVEASTKRYRRTLKTDPYRYKILFSGRLLKWKAPDEAWARVLAMRKKG